MRSRGREEADAADDRKNPPPHVGGYEDLLNQTVIIKLNGGLGTSMGLERAKSLLPVKEGLTFLDFIVKQILELQKRCSVQLRFLLMNSFSTSADTLEFLGRYPELGDPKSLELMQNQVPKVDAKTLRPVAWPQNPQLEWCPPGHGDLYPSLLGSGNLDKLLGEGIKYAFVSNSDNLGATLDLELLQFFAESNKPFLMEVAERTLQIKKGATLRGVVTRSCCGNRPNARKPICLLSRTSRNIDSSTPTRSGSGWTISKNCLRPKAVSFRCL